VANSQPVGLLGKVLKPLNKPIPLFTEVGPLEKNSLGQPERTRKACRAISSSDFNELMAQFVGQHGRLRYASAIPRTLNGLARSEAMRCESCASETQLKFGAEMIIHFSGRDGLDKPIVWVFPKLLVCMACGRTEFKIPQAELALLAGGIQKSEVSTFQESSDRIVPESRDSELRNGSPKGKA
jgi:hypothetical protein